MSTTITISDSDLDALRTIRNLDVHEPVKGAYAAVLERILAAAERPVRRGPGTDAVPRSIADRRADGRICPECGDACTPDFARLVWDCRGCLATFTEETRLHVRVPRELSAGDPSGDRGELHAVESSQPGLAAMATAVVLHPLPRGGHVVFTFRDGVRSVFLPGRRFQLIRSLLVPPAPHVAGELVPNADLIEQVWNDDPALGSRRDLNVLIGRCRQDLTAAGIAAAGLLERSPGGGATRVRLAPGALITIATDRHGGVTRNATALAQ